MTSANPTADATPSTYEDRFLARRGDLPGAGIAWIDSLRARAAAGFAANGLPTTRNEAWKYTNLNALRPLLLADAVAPVQASVDRVNGLLPATDAWRAVFVDGRYRADLSDLDDLPAGLRIRALAEALVGGSDVLEAMLGGDEIADAAPMLQLNTAFMTDGAVIELDKGAEIERPLELIFASTGGSATHAVRNIVIAGANSRLDLVETYIGLADGGDITSAVTQVQCHDGARLRRVKLQDDAPDAFHLGHLVADIGKDATFQNFELSKGARLSRSEAHAHLMARGADLRLDGAYLMRGKQHCDHTTTINHVAGDTNSQEVFKGVLDDAARAVFQGKIVVRPDAQRINGHQLNKTLLLSDKAEIDTKPELEIFADDVKCSHGATAGELDEDALFYLRSRGIPHDEARGMLIESFLGEAIEPIGNEVIRTAIGDRARSWFGRDAQEAAA